MSWASASRFACSYPWSINPHDVYVYPTSWEQAGYCREAFGSLCIELSPNYADDLLKKPKVQRAARAGFDKFAPFTSAEAQPEYVNFYAYLNTSADKHVMTVLDTLENTALMGCSCSIKRRIAGGIAGRRLTRSPYGGPTMRVFGKLKLSALGGLGVAVATIGAGLHPACAQEATGRYGMQFFVTPYLWLAGIDATTKTPLQRVPEVNSSVGPFQLLGHLDGAPFMGAFEVRQGPLGFLGDVLHVPVSTNITTRNVFFQGGNAALKANMGTGLVLYRLLDQPSQFADAGLGFRAWGFSADLSLNPGLLAGQSVNRSAGWGDPLIGGRYHYDFGNGFGLTAYGDVGGFGVGAHVDWQLIGTIDYTLNSWINLHLGYRSLNFNYEASDSNLGFNVHMKGPILAGTFRF